MLASLETDVANRLRVCAPNEVGYQFCAVCTAARWDAGVVMSLHYSVSLAFRGLKCKPLNCAGVDATDVIQPHTGDCLLKGPGD